MPTPRVLMSKIRQTLHLLADSGLSMRQVAAALAISKTTVSDIAMYARDAGVDWTLASTLSDDELHLAELNQAIAALLADLNRRPFKRLPGCRRSAFDA